MYLDKDILFRVIRNFPDNTRGKNDGIVEEFYFHDRVATLLNLKTIFFFSESFYLKIFFTSKFVLIDRMPLLRNDRQADLDTLMILLSKEISCVPDDHICLYPALRTFFNFERWDNFNFKCNK